MPPSQKSRPSVGIVGFGAFGRLLARHIAPYVPVVACDISRAAGHDLPPGVRFGELRQAAGCDVVVLAVPVERIRAAAQEVARFVRPGALVVDVGSVKVRPAFDMLAALPPDVDVIGTHPLFGPQSARDGIRGLKIVLCPLRGRRRLSEVRTFLKRVLGLNVIITTPDRHDAEAAAAQGLTHLIARLIMEMGPLPTSITTASFDLLREATEMVRDDAESVFLAIQQANPYAASVRQRFFERAEALRQMLDFPEAFAAEAVQAGSERSNATPVTGPCVERHNRAVPHAAAMEMKSP